MILKHKIKILKIVISILLRIGRTTPYRCKSDPYFKAEVVVKVVPDSRDADAKSEESSDAGEEIDGSVQLYFVKKY